jgi:hypothetical protein
MTTGFEHLTDEQMALQITTWAGRIPAGEARLLTLIGEFDRREAWAGAGLLSCAHWLSWQLGMGLKAAHERVRVARALTDLPVTAAAFTAGRLSWTQVRAITRVATPADEDTYVEVARHASGAQLERLARGVRRAQRIAEDEADPQAAAHRMRTRISYDSDGTFVLTVRLPTDDGAVLLTALEQARADLDRRPACGRPSSAEDPPHPASPTATAATWSDAVMHLARTCLHNTATDRPHTARHSRVRLTAHVDPLSGWARLHDGELLPPAAAPPLPRATPLRRRPTLPPPRLHPTPQTPRPPRPSMGRGRPDRPGQPGPDLRPPPHADPRSGPPAHPAPRPHPHRDHRRRSPRPTPSRPTLATR